MDIANKSHPTSIKTAFPFCDLTGRPEPAVLTSQLMKSIFLCEEDLALPHVLGCVTGVPVTRGQRDAAEGVGQPHFTPFPPAAQTLCSTPPPLPPPSSFLFPFVCSFLLYSLQLSLMETASQQKSPCRKAIAQRDFCRWL